MKTIGQLAYWGLALGLLVVMLTSLEYKVGQAFLISLVFGPCAIALEFWMPKAQKVLDKIYLSAALLVAVTLLIQVIHYFLWTSITQDGFISTQKEVSPMLVNPAFLGVILTALAVGDYFWGKWLGGRFRKENPSITFYSDRKSVTLPVKEIAYVESNDTEVHIVTLGGESYRNKTGISQWENLLGEPFIRIHRSYLVNADIAVLSSPDCILISGKELPVSRKYKDTVRIAFET
ncbi:MAG: LytTR family transcriptional regulator DNA-binding domain-containing protein [Bacteroidales bacterium]|nr:LytTR family transcriptional regulator DNA-binding domain-containing protein [Bacteroidales bacterium]